MLRTALSNSSNRHEFLSGLKSILTSYDYAILKFTEDALEEIGLNSDVDIAISRSDAEGFTNELKRHPLIQCLEDRTNSFMKVLSIYFNDGSFLSIDCIYKFKRRSIEYLQLDEVLASLYKDDNSISRASVEANFVYCFLFYNLNGEDIPVKYHQYFQDNLSQTGCVNILKRRFNIGINQISEAFQLTNDQRNKLLSRVGETNKNKRFNRLMNLFQYLKDHWATYRQKRGLVITVSGVDGAGKSTIIKDVHEILENRYREVVFLNRHRPGLLPILSTFMYGKEKAKKLSAENTPRQGTNKCTISSLIRFAYYYADFIIGQFYILLLYKYRGKIVLYDRYYFDFVVDMKRSNIKLPQWLPRYLFRTIIKPDINIFLYAESHIIRSRKKELPVNDIEELNENYVNYFNYLKGKFDGVYKIIHNDNREETVDKIINEYLDLRRNLLK